MNMFKALVVRENDGQVTHAIEEITEKALSQGEVLIKVAYSSVNYKDSLAVKVRGGVIHNYPMIPGIDLSGTVVSSTVNQFKEGQKVLATGFEIGMTHTGGFAEYARLPAKWIVPLPEGLTLKQSMIIGTAGYTAALSILALERSGMNPKHNPTILVTGASGGVGSTAIQLLAKNGYKNIHALSRKPEEEARLLTLGAAKVITPSDVSPQKKRPLDKEMFHYILDTVGGDLASTLIPQIHYGGSISMCGNAGGIQFSVTVLPFILRGISILGIDSVNVPLEQRPGVWARFADDWNITDESIVNETNLEGLSAIFDKLQKGIHVGRTIIKL